jgi:hypothetical protein
VRGLDGRTSVWTSCPRALSAAAIADPRKPLAPVTSTRDGADVPAAFPVVTTGAASAMTTSARSSRFMIPELCPSPCVLTGDSLGSIHDELRRLPPRAAKATTLTARRIIFPATGNPGSASVWERVVISSAAIPAIITARAFTSAGRRSPLGPRGHVTPSWI